MTLTLRLTRRWFYEILSGKKRTEYRKRGEYWDAMFRGRTVSQIRFVNGYGKHRPEMTVECLGISEGETPEMGPVWCISLGKIVDHPWTSSSSSSPSA